MGEIKSNLTQLLVSYLFTNAKWNKNQGLEIRIQGILPPRSTFKEAMVEDIKVKGSLPERVIMNRWDLRF